MKFITKLFTALRKNVFDSGRLDEDFKSFDTRQIFNKIYRHKLWGNSAAGIALSGTGSHKQQLVAPYVSIVRKVLLRSKYPPKMVDLGCGDFNVGMQFTGDVSTLIACDISDIVLAQNADGTFPENTFFLQLDITKDPLPKGNIACIRQVLQHLSNKDIRNFINALHTQKPYHALIVTEHISTSAEFVPNRDKYTGVSTRVHLKSGVDLALPPFGLNFSKKEILLELSEPCDNHAAIIRTILYTFD